MEYLEVSVPVRPCSTFLPTWPTVLLDVSILRGSRPVLQCSTVLRSSQEFRRGIPLDPASRKLWQLRALVRLARRQKMLQQGRKFMGFCFLARRLGLNGAVDRGEVEVCALEAGLAAFLVRSER